MRRLNKWLIGIVMILTVMLIAALLYLFTDNPFPRYETSGLIKTESNNIGEGKTVVIQADSLSKNISSKGQWFVDPGGRIMILHGINVGGSAKLPYTPLIASHQKELFFESVYTVSFTGRPFPLNEADEHFRRLYQWGYRFIRLVITWEAIEHAGPGKYDEDYLNYVQAIVKKAADYRINVFIDPHQDVWSRFTGGDGAPFWTLEKAGFDPARFSETGSALVHNIAGDPFPAMIWPTNYDKLATASMFTLFFGGNDFAPGVKMDSLSAQDYLQNHYLNAIKQLALKLKGLPNVIGFDSFNEPGAGYIGRSDLNAFGPLINGLMPTPFEGMVLGAGNALEIEKYEFALTGSKRKGKVLMNPNKVSAWKIPANDIWRTAGVWGYDAQQKPVLLRPDYFSVLNGKPVDFSETYFKPFVIKFKEVIHSVDSNWLIFTEAALFHGLPKFPENESEKMLNAGHSYDQATLITKKYFSWFGINVAKRKPVFGKTAIRNNLRNVVARRKEETIYSLGKKPTLIGEFGIPFDLVNSRAYMTGDFSDQEACLDRSFQSIESNLLSYTLWNYTSDNNNLHGDQWNGEDLSIFSKSQQTNPADINSGGRALKAAIRPYPYKIAGEPILYFFNMEAKEFYLKFKADKAISAPTEIFVPEFHYGKGFIVTHSPGKLAFDKESELLLFYPEGEGEQVVVITSKK